MSVKKLGEEIRIVDNVNNPRVGYGFQVKGMRSGNKYYRLQSGGTEVAERWIEIYKKSFTESIALTLYNRDTRKRSPLVYCLYKGNIYKFDRTGYSNAEMILQIMDLEDKERRKFERLIHKFSEAEKIEKEGQRPSIPEEVRIAVWRRDEGKCVKCCSRENLEYDHIIPISKGGSNTVRNIELLCEKCNREKKDNIQ